MKYFIKLISVLLSVFVFISLSSSPAKAFFYQSGESVVFSKEKTINEAAFVAGSSVVIDSNINGDLYCAGQSIVINGTVKGDVLCAAQNLKINGTIDGNVRSIAQNIEVAGKVSRNITIAAQSLTLGAKSSVLGDIFFGVQNVKLAGTMGRDLAGAGESITVSGSLLRHALVTGSNLSVADTGKIGGNLDYYMEKSAVATLADKSIKGTIVRHDLQSPEKPVTEENMAKISGAFIVTKTILGIISFAILGFVLIYFDRKGVEKKLVLITQKPVISGLVGFAVLITMPVALTILMATIIGIPLAILAMFIYIIALFIASFYPSVLFGKLFAEKVLKNAKISLAWQMVLGVTLFGTISCIPVIGWAIAFVSFCMGLGAITLSLLPEKK